MKKNPKGGWLTGTCGGFWVGRRFMGFPATLAEFGIGNFFQDNFLFMIAINGGIFDWVGLVVSQLIITRLNKIIYVFPGMESPSAECYARPQHVDLLKN
jgi:hypothetical protein